MMVSFFIPSLLPLTVGLVFFFLLAFVGRMIVGFVTGYVEPGPGDWISGLGIGLLVAFAVGLCYGAGVLILDLLGAS